ncbi:molybdenum ABC transporter ATP-binding protein [Luteitalea sp.]|uniref:molybdenum ABC transporter ATP-binding protein n=1 Tax=Luteitalea sp. TaxID=2004800 RepID=UPI000B0BF43A|nr:molybdenum ABC transporter ATP-binding protein [Luteitalea sp.]
MTERQLTVSLQQAAPIPLDVAFTCEPGQVLAIFGASGSGKTTILRSIAGLHHPARAQVRVGHQIWCDTDTGVCLPPHRRAVGLVFQEYALFPHLTALGNVMAASGHRPRSERRAHAEALLERVHLTSLASRRPQELSGGERQRVALARALAREPAVMLLDEPFAAVDRGVRRRLQDEVAALRRATTVPLILVTHDVDDVVRLASHVLVLERGRVLAMDSVERLTSRPDLSFLREAFGLGSVFDAVVADVDTERRLLALTFDGGRLLTPLRDSTPGTRVRVRVPAREVILASAPPDGLSLHNVLAGTVAAMHEETTTGQVVVQVAVGRLFLLAEVTRDAVQRLALAPGRPVHALIKSVSIDAHRTVDGEP